MITLYDSLLNKNKLTDRIDTYSDITGYIFPEKTSMGIESDFYVNKIDNGYAVDVIAGGIYGIKSGFFNNLRILKDKNSNDKTYSTYLSMMDTRYNVKDCKIIFDKGLDFHAGKNYSIIFDNCDINIGTKFSMRYWGNKMTFKNCHIKAQEFYDNEAGKTIWPGSDIDLDYFELKNKTNKVALFGTIFDIDGLDITYNRKFECPDKTKMDLFHSLRYYNKDKTKFGNQFIEKVKTLDIGELFFPGSKSVNSTLFSTVKINSKYKDFYMAIYNKKPSSLKRYKAIPLKTYAYAELQCKDKKGRDIFIAASENFF